MPTLEADCIEYEGFTLSRIFQAQGMSERVMRESSDPRVMVLMQVDGDAVVHVVDAGEDGILVRAGEMLITADHPQLKYTSPAHAARVEVSFSVPSAHFVGSTIHESLGSTVLAATMIGMVNEVLNDERELTQSEFLHLRAAMWELLSAIRGRFSDRARRVTPRVQRLHREAVGFIANAGAARPTVGEMCAALHVSERYLRTVFAKFDDSPSGLIRRSQVYRVVFALRDARFARPLRDEDFARSIGYSTARQMRGEVHAVLRSRRSQDAQLQAALRAVPPELLLAAGLTPVDGDPSAL